MFSQPNNAERPSPPHLMGEPSSTAGRLQVPFVPTPDPIVKRMLAVANIKPGEVVYDLGAGDGRILSLAVKNFGARAVGVELHGSRYEAIVKRIERERLSQSAGVIQADFFDINLSGADVVTLYLLTSVNSSMKPKLERELKTGARVVSHDFPIHGWVPIYVEKVRDRFSHSHMIYLYEVPRSVKQPASIARAVSKMTRWNGF